MVTGLIGKKVGMTQLFDADGTVHPATVLKAGPCVVAQVKTARERRLRGGAARARRGQADEGEQADAGPLQEGRRAADARAARDEGQGRRRCRQAGRPGQRLDLRRRRARGRDRHQPRQGLPGRREAPPLRGRPRDARLDVPPRARIDRRLVVSRRASSRACAWAGTWAPTASPCAT